MTIFDQARLSRRALIARAAAIGAGIGAGSLLARANPAGAANKIETARFSFKSRDPLSYRTRFEGGLSIRGSVIGPADAEELQSCRFLMIVDCVVDRLGVLDLSRCEILTVTRVDLVETSLYVGPMDDPERIRNIDFRDLSFQKPPGGVCLAMGPKKP